VNVSPVLPSDLVIQLETSYEPDSFEVEDFAAELNLISEITRGHW